MAKRIVIIGAGAAGILMGIRLAESGLEDYLILERSDDLGGTWHRNRYPGVACDVPALYYSYSFEPNTEVTRKFASGAELWSYFHRIATRYGVTDHIRFGTDVVAADWDGRRWTVTTASGEFVEADVVVSAVGRLDRPNLPAIPGMEDFAGVLSHSSRWDPELDLTDRRLGVIGNGSSGVQITTAASSVVEQLTLFQRTPQWIFPVQDEPIADKVQAAIRSSRDAARAHYDAFEAELLRTIGGIVDDDQRAAEDRERACREFLGTVRDPALRAKLTPDYAVGCKRLVMSEGFYDAVQRPNVTVETTGIERIEPTGVRTTDGRLHELDTLILATGFHADNYLRPMRVTGTDGRTLDELWAETYVNYKSVALPHMPNLFLVNGPFSPGGSQSVLTVIENHVGYVGQLVDRVVAEDVALSPDHTRSVELLDAIKERAKRTVWYTGGCTSWYLDRDGVPLVNPLTLPELQADMKTPDFADFVVHDLR